jgi:hypothetical protein
VIPACLTPDRRRCHLELKNPGLWDSQGAFGAFGAMHVHSLVAQLYIITPCSLFAVLSCPVLYCTVLYSTCGYLWLVLVGNATSSHLCTRHHRQRRRTSLQLPPRSLTAAHSSLPLSGQSGDSSPFFPPTSKPSHLQASLAGASHTSGCVAKPYQSVPGHGGLRFGQGGIP